MKTKYFFLAAIGAMTLASCSNDELVGDNSPTLGQEGDGSIQFSYNLPNATRAKDVTNPLIGATAAAKLGGMFVVEGTKGDEQTNSPSKDVVFDNYLVGYTANTAGTTESNTHNWEYVGKEAGISGRMTGGTGSTWKDLHPSGTSAQVQSIKYWDYSTKQYDFIAWSTGEREAVTTGAVADTKVDVTRIATGTGLSTGAYTFTVANATDLLQCYYTDIKTVLQANYGQPVTLEFKNMAAKVRVGLYETVPGYSVKDVKFYSADSDDGTTLGKYDPTDLGDASSATNAVLFTPSGSALPQGGAVTVIYPHIGKTYRDATPQPKDYNEASINVSSISAQSTTQTFGALTDNYGAEDPSGFEAAGKYLGRSLPDATFAGAAADDYYTAVFPNPNGQPLTLRVDYTLVSTDGSGEEINVYGAKAVVPSTYTEWQPNYAYTYIFKISDNSNGWTSKTSTDPKGLFPITFDAVVARFVDVNAEQTTITTVATPSITTYQQGHTKATDEYYYHKQTGVSTEFKDLYVQVMDNSTTTPTLKTDLKTSGKSRLFSVTKTGTTSISEASVMDALLNRTNNFDAASPEGRNGINLTTNANISNEVDEIVNGVDDQPIDLKAGGGTGAGYGKAAKIDIDNLSEGTYAYVYYSSIPDSEEKIYQVAAADGSNYSNYYKVSMPSGTANPLTVGNAAAGHVYFFKNVDAKGNFVSYTFKQTKVGESVVGLVDGGVVPTTKDDSGSFDSTAFYFDVYNKNNGAYAVKVFKVVTSEP